MKETVTIIICDICFSKHSSLANIKTYGDKDICYYCVNHLLKWALKNMPICTGCQNTRYQEEIVYDPSGRNDYQKIICRICKGSLENILNKTFLGDGNTEHFSNDDY